MGYKKTSILRNIQNRLEKENDYEVIWINLWQLKESKYSIIKIENQINEFLNKVYFSYPKNFIQFFKMTSGLLNDKLEKIFDIFKLYQNKNIENAKNNLNKILEEALKNVSIKN